MPSRVIRGEINRSESLSRVSVEAELTFRALITAVDDFGRFDARPAILKAELFPLRESITPARVEAWIAELAEDGCVQVYQVDGRPFLALTGWERHRGEGRRGKSSRFPAPPSVSADRPALPRKSEETHADPSGKREAGSGKREAGDGRRVAGESEGDRAPTGAPDADLAPILPGEFRPPEKAAAPKRPRAVLTPPPDDLAPEEHEALARWCEAKARDPAEPAAAGYAACAPRLRSLVEACLGHHRGKGNRHASWYATAQTWVRNEAEGRFGSARASPGGPLAARRTFAQQAFDNTVEAGVRAAHAAIRDPRLKAL